MRFMEFLVAVVLSGAPGSTATAPMTFKIAPDTTENKISRIVQNNGQYEIFAAGRIDEGAPARFRRFVALHKIDWAKVYLDSPGGSLAAGLELGEAFRKLEFDTAIGAFGDSYGTPKSSVCASSCAYAFAGGLNRFFDDYSGRLGIHQFYAGGDNVGNIGDTQVVSAVLISYLDRMGVNAKAYTIAATAGSDEMVWLTPAQAQSVGLANNGSHPTTAEIKLVGMTPYLRLEQVHHNVTTRALINCDKGQISITAGPVTTPELTAMKAEGVARSYYELDGKELLAVSGRSGVQPNGSVLWVSRDISDAMVTKLLQTEQLDIWTENGGIMRWGSGMEIRSVREKIASFVKNCKIT